jgi:glycosyltransferase involved in cell wall biosynthesis
MATTDHIRQTNTRCRPTVSCLLPVYNGEKYIRESIKSILAQTFSDFELIIVNDGSTDSSLEIIQQMRTIDDRIVLINHRHSGIIGALNVGLAAARGAFIARMDADDISMPDRFLVQYEFLRDNPDVVLVGGLCGSINDQGHPSITSTTGNRHARADLLDFPPKVVTALHPLIMVRAETLRSIGGYSSRYEHAEDYDMFMRISQFGRIAHVDKRILDYRIHAENISVTKLVDQERHAAEAEIDNVGITRSRRGLRNLRLATDTFDAYVSIRILRREYALGTLNEPAVFFSIFWKILKGALKSEFYTTGRLALMLVNHAIRSAKTAIFRKATSILPFA